MFTASTLARRMLRYLEVGRIFWLFVVLCCVVNDGAVLNTKSSEILQYFFLGAWFSLGT